MFAMTACTDALIDDEGGIDGAGTGKGTGELVLFTAGRTNSSLSATRADGDSGGGNANVDGYTETPGETYYMGHSSRFVCRMYYIADNASEKDFDLTDNTKTITWFVVDGNVGNSLYWNKEYKDVVLSDDTEVDKTSEENKSKYDSYGNDKTATFFYWQNRKNHAFLAWTDLNKAKNNDFKYGRYQGNLKMDPEDIIYTEHTGEKRRQMLRTRYVVAGSNVLFNQSLKECADYVVAHYDAIKALEEQRTLIAECPWHEGITLRYTAYNNIFYYSSNVGSTNPVYDATDSRLIAYDFGPYIYGIWGEDQRLAYELQDGDHIEPDTDGKDWVKNSAGVIVALRETKEVGAGDDHDATKDFPIEPAPTDPDAPTTITKYYKYYYWAYRYGNPLYDDKQEPNTKVAIYLHYDEKESEVINEYKANKFDLTHGTRRSIADQPDPCQALTIMKPAGATQAANRVNLYFKHQFSQVQVNVKSSSDNSVDIRANQIQKVELLGVTEEGYVFNELSKMTVKEGGVTKEVYTVHPAAYKDVDVSQYEDVLATNPYGTSLELFDMGEHAPGYLKSFNAITFGLLKAIRITWTETSNNGGQTHVATFKVTDTNLSTLKSGRKYIWNIEIRRGTLAVITTTIDDWIVPTDISANGSNNLNYTTEGIIQN